MYPTEQWRNQTVKVEGNAALPKISGKFKKCFQCSVNLYGSFT